MFELGLSIIAYRYKGSRLDPVAAGFTPAFNHNQKILLAVLERGRKARGYGIRSRT
jgi:hypothetical protein